MKRKRAALAEERARVHHILWQEESAHLEQERAEREHIWRQQVAHKRLHESLANEQRLIEARKRFLESQDLLRRLIKEKDERAEQIVQSAQR